jgi:hypothetical protein
MMNKSTAMQAGRCFREFERYMMISDDHYGKRGIPENSENAVRSEVQASEVYQQLFVVSFTVTKRLNTTNYGQDAIELGILMALSPSSVCSWRAFGREAGCHSHIQRPYIATEWPTVCWRPLVPWTCEIASNVSRYLAGRQLILALVYRRQFQSPGEAQRSWQNDLYCYLELFFLLFTRLGVYMR